MPSLTKLGSHRSGVAHMTMFTPAGPICEASSYWPAERLGQQKVGLQVGKPFQCRRKGSAPLGGGLGRLVPSAIMRLMAATAVVRPARSAQLQCQASSGKRPAHAACPGSTGWEQPMQRSRSLPISTVIGRSPSTPSPLLRHAAAQLQRRRPRRKRIRHSGR
jgi:hypothetical protein